MAENAKGEIVASERAFKYFQQIEKSLVQKIYELYKPDFELFRYSITEFLWSLLQKPLKCHIYLLKLNHEI